MGVTEFWFGLASGVMANMIWSQRRRVRYWIHRLSQRDIGVPFEPERVGLYMINKWSRARPLTPGRQRVTIVQRPQMHEFFKQQEWASLREPTDDDGALCYMVDFHIDHRESKGGQLFKIDVAKSTFSEYLATKRYLEEYLDTEAKVVTMLKQPNGLRRFALKAPPSSIKINVALITEGSKFLVLRRSGVVEGKQGKWTVGPNESMKSPSGVTRDNPIESFFALAQRALWEEVGLDPNDYGQISVSWIGYYVKDLNVKVFAQAKTYLTEDEVNKKLFRTAAGAFEHDAVEWLPFNRPTVMDIVSNWETGDRSSGPS